uniref:Transposase Tc1-like domain-containing protein n=1 Tax=Oncorhynchus tshawytscha TaxID=74940 RepID=A0AAZ3S6H4_ONCTS
MRLKELSVELRRDRIVSRHKSGEGYQNISAALKVPNWKKFGTTKTLPRAGCLAKLRNWGRRTLVREVTKNPVDTLTNLQISFIEMGETSRRTTISAALHQSGLYERSRHQTLQSCYKRQRVATLKNLKYIFGYHMFHVPFQFVFTIILQCRK